jgi:hypothetical protein
VSKAWIDVDRFDSPNAGTPPAIKPAMVKVVRTPRRDIIEQSSNFSVPIAPRRESQTFWRWSARFARDLRKSAVPSTPTECEAAAKAYLRAAHAYMLISMPTGTSTIFGVFHAILDLLSHRTAQCRTPQR